MYLQSVSQLKLEPLINRDTELSRAVTKDLVFWSRRLNRRIFFPPAIADNHRVEKSAVRGDVRSNDFERSKAVVRSIRSWNGWSGMDGGDWCRM